MKKAINQKIKFDLSPNQSYSVILTKGANTYQLNFGLRENAMEWFIKYITEEANFCQLIGSKSTIGLYRITDNTDVKCLRQLQILGFSK
jgi:hypothetical protein